MARFYGKVGYALGELVDDVWTESIVERPYYGEVLNESRNLVSSDKVMDDVRLSKRISIVADAFAFENFVDLKYVDWMGTLWTVPTVEVERPRLILSLGGVYHGQKPTA